MKTATAKKHVDELHTEISQWKGEIELHRDELKIFQHQLGEILMKNTGSEIAKEAEHFQNQFIRQGEVGDELYHDLKIADHALAEKSKGNSSAHHILVDDHSELRDKMETYVRLFDELKEEYRKFRLKWF